LHLRNLCAKSVRSVIPRNFCGTRLGADGSLAATDSSILSTLCCSGKS
jgi:hypothetical protein